VEKTVPAGSWAAVLTTEANCTNAMCVFNADVLDTDLDANVRNLDTVASSTTGQGVCQNFGAVDTKKQTARTHEEDARQCGQEKPLYCERTEGAGGGRSCNNNSGTGVHPIRGIRFPEK
jgi:hypothetical protein